MRAINFLKITAAGNDFVMIDNRSGKNKLSAAAIEKICSRKFGVGADGVIFLEKSHIADFRMRYFNSDGSRASMCGNGARSIVRFAKILGAIGRGKSEGSFQSDAGIIGYKFLKNNLIKVGLTNPRDLEIDFGFKVGGKKLTASFINTGVPHTVIFISENRDVFPRHIDFDNLQIEAIGREIRFHERFKPRGGTNVNFVDVVRGARKSFIKVRTYERGVEGETLACGTGVTASALISGIKKMVEPPVKVLTRGGEILEVDYDLIFSKHSSRPAAGETHGRHSILPDIKEVHLSGSAEVAFEGRVSV